MTTVNYNEDPFLPEGARWIEPAPQPARPAPRPARAHSSPTTMPPAPADAVVHISETRDRILGEMALRAKHGDDAVGGEETGFTELDENILVDAGRLFVLGAREGVGKTAWGLQVARTIGTRKDPRTGRGGTVLYFITEMSVEQVTERILASFAHLPVRAIKKGVNDKTIAAIEKAYDLLAQSGINVVDAAGWSIDDICEAAQQFKQNNPDLRAVFVDNITGVNPATVKRGQGSHEYIGEIVTKLNALASEATGVGAPVWAFAHLTRANPQNPDKTPTAQSFAGSDQINRWAHTLVLLHRKEDGPKYNDEKEYQERAGREAGFDNAPPIHGTHHATTHELIVVKNRDGATFKCDLVFIGPQMRFLNPDTPTVRPYSAPEAESENRAAFRRDLQELISRTSAKWLK